MWGKCFPLINDQLIFEGLKIYIQNNIAYCAFPNAASVIACWHPGTGIADSNKSFRAQKLFMPIVCVNQD